MLQWCVFMILTYEEHQTLVITGRNEVVAKVIFLHVSVIHSVHRGEGVCLSACWDTTPPIWSRPPRARQTTPPPRSRHHPPDRADHPPPLEQTPPDQADHPHPPPLEQTPPRTRQTPPHSRHPSPHPPGKQTSAYGLRAVGTHPTGMHSCL